MLWLCKRPTCLLLPGSVYSQWTIYMSVSQRGKLRWQDWDLHLQGPKPTCESDAFGSLHRPFHQWNFCDKWRQWGVSVNLRPGQTKLTSRASSDPPPVVSPLTACAGGKMHTQTQRNDEDNILPINVDILGLCEWKRLSKLKGGSCLLTLFNKGNLPVEINTNITPVIIC